MAVSKRTTIMNRLKWNLIPIQEAWQRIEKGGVNWILFAGDSFEPEEFEYLTEYQASPEEIDAVNSALRDVEESHALDVRLGDTALGEYLAL